jgi:hypothetical protein
VIHGVSQYVQQRLEQHLDDGLVRFRLRAFDDESCWLFEVARHFPKQAREPGKRLA